MKKLICLSAVLWLLCASLPAWGEGTVCATPEAFVAYLREIALTEPPLTNMRFQVPCTEELVKRLNSDMEELKRLERAAGMVEAHFDVPYRDRITYINSKFIDYLPVITSLDVFDEHIEALADSIDDTFYFYVDPSVRNVINELDMRERIAYGNTPLELQPWYTMLPDVTQCRVKYSDGILLLHAYRTGTRSQLQDDDLKTAYDIAVSAVRGLKGRTDEEKARELHDWLCRHVRYGSGKSGHPGAVSALKYGQCVCYGYADAYYLLCVMAGIPCVYQGGWIGEKPTHVTSWEAEGASHAWNLIRIGGKWSMVDVTWDDLETGIRYNYFMMGKRQVRQERNWEETEYTRLWAD